jgi:hypothetical protein
MELQTREEEEAEEPVVAAEVAMVAQELLLSVTQILSN